MQLLAKFALIAAAVAAAIVWAGSLTVSTDTLPEIILPPDAVQSERITVENMADVLYQTCPDIARWGNDIEWVRGRFTDAAPYQQREKGWQYQVELQVKVRERPSLIPWTYYASGQVCHYSVGTSLDEPGIYLSKDPCKKLCDTRRDFISLK